MIKYNSITHDLLMVAKVFTTPFSAEEALRVVVTLEKPSRVERSAQILVKYGFLEEFPEKKYLITSSGRQELFNLIRAKGLGDRQKILDDDDL
jgi:hypothetical protein